ncbi:MAG TPA: DUF5343 domain-containing protein [Gaiellaceae bacterium]|nr:DUF5343 domain-containing protein [Gaiellaceae bacterium]
MAVPSSYLYSVNHVPQILEAIQRAGIPSKFTYEFFSKQLGFRSSSDRPFIPLLRQMGFLDDAGAPTERYRRFKDKSLAGSTLAEGLRDAYADVFASDQDAQNLTIDELTGIFGRLSGKSESTAYRMAATFRALASHASFEVSAREPEGGEEADIPNIGDVVDDEQPSDGRRISGLKLHHDVHVHLPVSTDIAVYDAIFRALRQNLAG